MDTRTNILTLIEHNSFYGSEISLEQIKDVIRNIPSITLINYIACFGVNLYLNENTDDSEEIQRTLVNCLVAKCDLETSKKCEKVFNEHIEKGHSPVLFWNYSNLLFYGVIFSRFNNKRLRNLGASEANAFLKAYLAINSIANKKINIEEDELKKAEKDEQIEDVVMPQFIYQKDYVSTTDYNNQVTRGVMFFEYLEQHSKYKDLVNEFYASKNVSGYLRMFKNLMILFAEINIGEGKTRNQLVKLEQYHSEGCVDLSFIDTLCINSCINEYVEDESFGQLRSRFLYKLNRFQFFILNVNFLIDQFYKAQVFSFNAFLKDKNVKNEFLSEKAKEFMEEKYLPVVINKCFPTYVRFFGEECKNSNGEELCDVYIRNDKRICLVEFKDVMLNSAAKNSADKKTLYAAFERKLEENQKKKPKGITQLINAIKDIDDNGISFDSAIPEPILELFPIVLYTDFSFGVEGLNKIYKDKFLNKIKDLSLLNIHVNDITFINLSYFELHEDYLAMGYLNFFEMLSSYHQHISDPKFHLTPFEVYSRFYMKENVPQDLKLPQSYQNLITRITGA